jgi:PIN domain nuclease of toxin-antitoxin system
MILDTCALLFLANGDPRLTSDTRRRLGALPVRWFCAISTFEVALKQASGKLALPLPAHLWMGDLAARYELREVVLDSALCAEAALLPRHHRDPCDRFIIAAARRLAVPVVTVDPKFAAYGVVVVA